MAEVVISAVIFAAGVLMLRWVLIRMGLLNGAASKEADSIKSLVALRTLSRLWREEEARTIKMTDLAKLWKKDDEAPMEPDPEFIHDTSRAFYKAYIKGQRIFQGPAGRVVMELLLLLDREGDCPSVVPMEVSQDPEATLGRKEKSTYDIFARFTLLEHSIHVAEEARGIFGDGPDLAEAFVASLGHDIGKLPRHRDGLYALGDHPMLSSALLDSLPQFKALPNRAEIQSAVRTHHGQGKMKDDDTFAKLFYEADKAARLREIGEFTAAKGEEARRANVEKPIPTIEPTVEHKPAVVLPVEVAMAKAGAALESMDEKSEPTKRGEARAEIQKAEIPWFQSDVFLAKIKPVINKTKPFEGKWKAISMRDGNVYVQTGYLWDVARELGMAINDPLIRLGEGDQRVRQEILLGIVSQLRVDGHIAVGLIKDGYIGGKFTLKVKSPQGQKEFSYYLTPFLAEAFASTVSRLEQEKEGNTKNVEEIVPDYAG